jgi:tetratricopeptide (TPR) repeat protein
LRGPSGVGKAAITEECGRSIRSNDNTVLLGETPRSGGASYAPFRAIFTALDDQPTPFETVTPSNEEMDTEDYQSMRLSLFYDLYKRLQDHALETGPTLLVLRDLQWAGSATLDLLSFLLTRLDDEPVSLLCTVNTEHQEDEADVLTRLGDEQRPVTEELLMPVEVTPLDRWEFEPLVCWHLQVEAAPDEFLDALHDHTGGNPEYVASVLDHLRDTDRLDPETETYPTDTEEFAVPEATQSIVEARVERLDDVHREVLEAAAVVGERVSLAVLKGMVEPSESALRPIAQDLVQNALWESSDVVTAILSRTYKFRTPIARRAILDDITADRRSELHETAAEAILDTTLSPDRLKEAVAARHYDDAGQPERALEQYRAAGKRATRLYNHDEAVEHYQRALGLAKTLGHTETRLDILESLSRVQYCKGDAGAAADSLERLLDRTDDPERIQSVELARWRMAREQGNFEQADECARSGIEAVDEPTPLSCRFWGMLGRIALKRGNVEQATEYFDHQESLVEQFDETVTKGNLYYNRALLARSRGDLEEAIELAEEAIVYHRRDESSREVASSQNLLGVAHNERNQNQKAIQAYEASRERIQGVGDRIFELSLDLNRANCTFARGNWSAAIEQYENTTELTRTLDQEFLLVRCLINRCMIYCYRGALQSARDCVNEALTIAESIGEASTIAAAKVERTALELFEDNLDSARTDGTSARDHASDVLPNFTAKAECHLGDIERVAGNHQRALDYYRQARDRAADCDSTPWYCYATAGCAAMRLQEGQTDRALQEARDARAETHNYVVILTHERVMLARCLHATGQTEAALEETETALSTARDVEATLLESRVLLERARLTRETEPDQAAQQLEAALVLATAAGAELLERQCQAALDALGNGEHIESTTN